MTCSWAGCRTLAVAVIEDWPMCAEHRREHWDEFGRPCRVCGRGHSGSGDVCEDCRDGRTRDHAVRQLHAAGASARETARILGVHVSTVCDDRRRLGLRPLPPGPLPSQPHGTLAAARRHRRRDEPLCRSCKQAELRDSQDRYRKKQSAPGCDPDALGASQPATYDRKATS